MKPKQQIYLTFICFIFCIIVGLVFLLSVNKTVNQEKINSTQTLLFKRCVNLKMKTEPSKIKFCNDIY